MSIRVGTLDVPVVWSPSDLVGPDSDGHVGRTQPIRAIVHHRVVGTLESMTNVTFKPSADPLLTPGERRVSSHFGIGFSWGGYESLVLPVELDGIRSLLQLLGRLNPYRHQNLGHVIFDRVQ